MDFANAVNGPQVLRVQIGLVDEDRTSNTEGTAEFRHPLQIVKAGRRRLGDEQRQTSLGERTDDRTTDARGTIAQDQVQAQPGGLFPGLGLEQGHELAGVLLTGIELGMDHGTEAGFTFVPGATKAVLESDGRLWTKGHTDLTTFAMAGIHHEVLTIMMNGVISTNVCTGSASRAGSRFDHCHMARQKGSAAPNSWVRQ